ncbi:hypothetical protein [Terracidiphilus sp.]|jgi:hypothetical protein|uniref:hypothetical protein n=1 Tax=Terracidiphilus sp. TaxID=1964191 RepID=UPI003C16B878
MTESQIQCLKDHVDKTVEIETVDSERLVAKVLAVFHDSDYDEHELFYELVSTNMIEAYKHLGEAGGYALDFDKIVSVQPHTNSGILAGS